MSEYINIAIALNEKVIVPACVMVHSLVTNNKSRPVHIYVLHSDLTEECCRLLTDTACCDCSDNQIEFIKIDSDRFKGLPYTQFWSVETYYRIMLPELLGHEMERILYLDIDIIVNKDISDFYDTDFEENLLVVTRDAVVEDMIAQVKSENRKWNMLFSECKNDGMTYFCAGVLLMNLKALKEQFSFDKYMTYFEQIKDKIVFLDQDLLNYVHYKNVKFVDEIKYDLFAAIAHENGMSYEEVKNNVSILHFAGPAKPWTVNLIRYDIEKIWWENAKDMPFYHEVLEQVFFSMCESTFAERKMQELAAQNKELQGMIQKCQSQIERLYPGN